MFLNFPAMLSYAFRFGSCYSFPIITDLVKIYKFSFFIVFITFLSLFILLSQTHETLFPPMRSSEYSCIPIFQMLLFVSPLSMSMTLLGKRVSRKHNIWCLGPNWGFWHFGKGLSCFFYSAFHLLRVVHWSLIIVPK